MIKLTRLKHRGLIRLTGPDRLTFLKGLVAGCVEKISPTQGLYTVFLTPQGRVRCDFFIIQHNEDWIIDSSKEKTSLLLSLLALYKMRSDVTLHDVTHEFNVYAQWLSHNPEGGVGEHEGVQALAPCQLQDHPQVLCYADPRLPELGHRFLVPSQGEYSFLFKGKDEVTEDCYNYHRLQWGIPEMGVDMICDKSIPLECGLDELQAIDWKKGCYIGQELNARARYRGLIRKRLIPVTVQKEDFETLLGVLPGAPVLQNNEPVGELRSLQHPYGLCYLRLEALNKEAPLIVNGVSLTPFFPYWMKIPPLNEAPHV